MLRKLMKYELRATGRIFLPFFGALIVLSLLNKLFYSNRAENMMRTLRQNGKGLPIEITRVISMALFIFLICAIFMLAAIVMIQRFYKNLLGDEGYLMFTLPVRPWQLITSKAAVSCMWLVVSGLVTLLACLLMMASLGDIIDIFAGLPMSFRNLTPQSALHGVLLSFEVCLLMLVYLFYFILLVYAAIAVGQLWSAHKLLGAFGAFIVLNTAFQIITFSAVWVFDKLTDMISLPARWGDQHILTVMHAGIWMVLLWGALMGAACFALANWLLGKKLNLE